MSAYISTSYSDPLKKYFGEVCQVFSFTEKKEDFSTAKTIAIALSVFTVAPFLIAALLLGVTLGLEKIFSLCCDSSSIKEKIERQRAAHLPSSKSQTPTVSTIDRPARVSSQMQCNERQINFLEKKAKEFCKEIEDKQLSSSVQTHLKKALNTLNSRSSSQLNIMPQVQELLIELEKSLPDDRMQKVRGFFCRYFPRPDQFSEMRRDFLREAFIDFFEYKKEQRDMDINVCHSVGFFRSAMWETWENPDFNENPQEYVDKWRDSRPIAASNRKFQEFLRIHYPPVVEDSL